VLVVDDGSTDDTGKVLADRIAKGDGRVRHIRHSRSAGQSAAVRSGLDRLARSRRRCPLYRAAGFEVTGRCPRRAAEIMILQCLFWVIRDRVGQPQVRAWSAMSMKAEVI